MTELVGGSVIKTLISKKTLRN